MGTPTNKGARPLEWNNLKMGESTTSSVTWYYMLRELSTVNELCKLSLSSMSRRRLCEPYELSEPLMSSESPASRRGYRRATRAKDCCLGFWRATWAVDQPHDTSWAVVRVYKIAITTINETINQCNNQRNNQPDFTHLGNRVWFVSTSYVSCRRSTRAVVSHLRAQQALSTPYLHTSHVEILCECRASCVRGCVEHNSTYG